MAGSMLIKCVGCGKTNRVPAVLTKKLACGGCKRVFTPMELTKNVFPDPNPPKVEFGGDLDDSERYCNGCGELEDDCECDECE